MFQLYVFFSVRFLIKIQVETISQMTYSVLCVALNTAHLLAQFGGACEAGMLADLIFTSR